MTKPGPHRLLLCALAALGAGVLGWGHASAQGSKVVVLHHADSLVGKVIEGENARELIGQVHISQENVQIFCDRALQYVERGVVVLTGNVLVEDGRITMRSPRGVYHRDERIAEAFDGVQLDDGKVHLDAEYGRYEIESRIGFFRTKVVIRDTASTVTADSVLYYREERRSLARGNVTVVSPADQMTIRGGRLDHDAERQFSRMMLDPELVQTDTAASGRIDTLVVQSRVMEAYRDSSRRFIAIDSVRIARRELAAIAGLALFFSRGDSMLLRRKPVVWYQDTQVSGDSLNVYVQDRRLRLVHVMGNARAMSRSDSLFPDRYDQMTGETMLMRFRNQRLEEIDVRTQAISLYHLYEDSLANGLNKTSGDRIVMAFEEGRVRSITVVGGVEGTYVPENVLRRQAADYALPGFQWRTDRPTMGMMRHRARAVQGSRPARQERVRSHR